MRVFVDANIIVAVLNKEYPLFSNAARILSLHGKRNIQIFTSPLCLAIAFYFSGKKSGEKLARKKMEILSQNISVTKTDQETVQKTLSNKIIHDFEDGLEYYSALNQECTHIITENLSDYYFSEIPVMNAEDFMLNLTTSQP